MGKRKDHLKRLASPKSWPIKKKGIKWVKRPFPGPHSFKLGLPITIVLREMLCYAKTLKEVRSILNNKEILVDKINHIKLSQLIF